MKEFQLGQHPAGTSVNRRENGFRHRFLSESYPYLFKNETVPDTVLPLLP